MTFPVPFPATTDFPAGTVGHKSEGEKIGQGRAFPGPAEQREARVSPARLSHMKWGEE